MLPDSRTCTKCRIDKPLSEFSKAPGGKYGRKANCKACDAARHAALHPSQPRKRREIDVEAARKRLEQQQCQPRTCGRCGETKPPEDFSPRGERYGVVLRKTTCKECAARQAREWYGRHTERGLTNRRRLQLKADYGLTPEQYDAMLEAQGGVCALCARPERAKRDGKVMRMPVDHCHETGRVRALLCHACNRAIGLLGEDVELLRRAIDYLLRHKSEAMAS